MNIFQVLGILCWIASAILIIWMVADFFKTNTGYDEHYLLSSLEGHDEIAEQERKHQVDRENKKKA